eukprot:6172325-Pleurochrysis_carterae.AAC.2
MVSETVSGVGASLFFRACRRRFHERERPGLRVRLRERSSASDFERSSERASAPARSSERERGKSPCAGAPSRVTSITLGGEMVISTHSAPISPPSAHPFSVLREKRGIGGSEDDRLRVICGISAKSICGRTRRQAERKSTCA